MRSASSLPWLSRGISLPRCWCSPLLRVRRFTAFVLLAVETEPTSGAETLAVSFDPKMLDARFEQPFSGSQYVLLAYKNEYRKLGTLNRYRWKGPGSRW